MYSRICLLYRYLYSTYIFTQFQYFTSKRNTYLFDNFKVEKKESLEEN